MGQHVTTTVNPILHRRSVVDDTPVEMLEAQHGNTRPVRFERGYECATCLRVFPRSKVMLIDGKAYCLPYKHYIDPLADKELNE